MMTRSGYRGVITVSAVLDAVNATGDSLAKRLMLGALREVSPEYAWVMDRKGRVDVAHGSTAETLR